MKIGGVDPTTLKAEEVLVLPRGEDVIVFRAQGLKDMEEFFKLCPEPEPPRKQTREGVVADLEDDGYQKMLVEHRRRYMSYMVIRALEPSQIEWDSVQLDNPLTWTNWERDLKVAGLMQVECNRIVSLVMQANCLDEAKLDKARELFQRGTPGPSGA